VPIEAWSLEGENTNSLMELLEWILQSLYAFMVLKVSVNRQIVDLSALY